jgi:hypothetical protein
MSKSSLVNVTVPAYSGNYSIGRSGRKIEAITIHHMAGVMSAEQCGKVFQAKGRNGSSHYGIGNDGKIGLYVDESNTAWTNSNWDSNCKSVTIETSNSSTGGQWPVGDKALKSLIKLVADIAKRNNLGTLVKGKNVTWHSMFTSTTCPGAYLLSKMDYIIAEANKINNPPKEELTIKNITNKKVRLKIDANLWNFDFDTYAEAKSVKQYKKGDIIEVSAIAYHPLGAQYYMTEYSYSKNIHNGFNTVDCEDYVEKKLKSIDTIAKEVIQGKWGNGADRKTRLTKAGYNYKEVQARVNQLLK